MKNDTFLLGSMFASAAVFAQIEPSKKSAEQLYNEQAAKIFEPLLNPPLPQNRPQPHYRNRYRGLLGRYATKT